MQPPSPDQRAVCQDGQSDAGLLAFLDFLLLTLMTLATQPPPGTPTTDLEVAGHRNTPLHPAEAPLELTIQTDGRLAYQGQILTQDQLQARIGDSRPHLLVHVPASLPSQVLLRSLIQVRGHVVSISVRSLSEE